MTRCMKKLYSRLCLPGPHAVLGDGSNALVAMQAEMHSPGHNFSWGKICPDGFLNKLWSAYQRCTRSRLTSSRCCLPEANTGELEVSVISALSQNQPNILSVNAATTARLKIRQHLSMCNVSINTTKAPRLILTRCLN